MSPRATPIYLDHHATTPVDPRVVEAMLPYFSEVFGNPASTTHSFGWQAKEAVDGARQSLANALGAKPKEIVFTSGATESNNLAIRGVAESLKRKGNHILSVATEHPAVLDPLAKLATRGYEVTLLPVTPAPQPEAGRLRPEQVAEALREDTILVSVMLANNEIGVLQPLAEIGQICRQRGVLLHSDATQAVGRIPVNVQQLHVDLLSFSGHKLYGPRGVGALYVRRTPARLEPQMLGGGHEGGLRSGTLNVPGIVGLARALELCLAEMPAEMPRLRALRDRLAEGLLTAVPEVALNGPALVPEWRLPGNLNLSFAGVEGESLLLSAPEVALSSGSACSSAQPEPSHVLRALGLDDLQARSSLRFGLGRSNTAEEVEQAIAALAGAVMRLRRMGGP
jgi:cysteine desulfurase